jgi:cytochrome c-type biogenesis protein CcmE
MSDARRQRRVWYAVGGVLITAFLVYGATSFKSYLTPYVSFEEAQRSAAKVQVAGALVQGSSEYLATEELLQFALLDDEGHSMRVRYAGPKPGNFEEATQVVAVGKFADGVFHAENLLVKCPSKYQGIEEDPSAHG